MLAQARRTACESEGGDFFGWCTQGFTLGYHISGRWPCGAGRSSQLWAVLFNTGGVVGVAQGQLKV